jgi:hypothetical protein
MARFQDNLPINMWHLVQFKIFNETTPSVSSTEITAQFNDPQLGGLIRIDIKGHGFGFNPLLGRDGIIGTLNSIEVDVNGSLAYGLTGLSADVHTLAVDITNLNFVGALNYLLKGNDKIVDANHGPTHLAGGPGNNTFVFNPNFGQVEIFDFKPGTIVNHDTLDVRLVPGITSLHQLKTTPGAITYNAHHFVQIHDTMGDTITLDHVKSFSLLHSYDFHF